jgi:hypothetical protein
MPADVVTGAALMLARPLRGYAAADVHAAGVIMLAGSELIMTGLAALLAARLVRSPGGARQRRARQADSTLKEYNSYLASLEVRSPERVRGSAPSGHGQAGG